MITLCKTGMDSSRGNLYKHIASFKFQSECRGFYLYVIINMYSFCCFLVVSLQTKRGTTQANKHFISHRLYSGQKCFLCTCNILKAKQIMFPTFEQCAY